MRSSRPTILNSSVTELKEKKKKMKKNSSSKGLLIDWLLKALNQQLYKGLKWYDRKRNIFCIHWTHKSAEQWSKTDLEPFEAWAQYKGKLHGKNEKQLKATFRCALNSKKELREVQRDKSKRYWQFVDPKLTEKETTKKKQRGNRGFGDDISREGIHDNILFNGVSSLKINSSGEAETLTAPKLPAFESFCSFAFLTPPHQDNEISFNSTESELSRQKTSTQENYRLNCDLENRINPSIPSCNVSNIFSNSLSSAGSSEVENSRTAMLPSFESFCSLSSITPPPQTNEVYFNCTEYKTRYTPSPDHSRLTPPLKDFQRTSPFNSFYKPSSDVWQPNCWTTQTHQDSSFNQFFLDDFDAMHKSMIHQQIDDSIRMHFTEMDQSVPVMNTSQNDQIVNKQHNFKAIYENNQLEQMKLEDEYVLSDDVDQEACERIMQVLNRLTPPSETGPYVYNS